MTISKCQSRNDISKWQSRNDNLEMTISKWQFRNRHFEMPFCTEKAKNLLYPLIQNLWKSVQRFRRYNQKTNDSFHTIYLIMSHLEIVISRLSFRDCHFEITISRCHFEIVISRLSFWDWHLEMLHRESQESPLSSHPKIVRIRPAVKKI